MGGYTPYFSKYAVGGVVESALGLIYTMNIILRF